MDRERITLIINYALFILGIVFVLIGIVAIITTINLPPTPAYSALFWAGLLMLIFGIRGIRKSKKQ